MARPQKQTVDYFPHDALASEGTTLTILEDQFGNDGYSFWFRLLERLCATPGHVMDCRNPARWQFLLAKTHVSEDIGCRILNLLAELDAIDADLWLDKVIWCQNLVDNITDVYKNRRALIPQKPSVNGNNPLVSVVSTEDNPTAGVVSTSESTQSKLKESKLKESKVEKKETFNSFKEQLRTEYTDLNIDEEYKKFTLYWEEGSKKLQRPKLAFVNWLNKAREIKGEKGLGKNAGVNRINSDDPDKYTKGKYGHMVQR